MKPLQVVRYKPKWKPIAFDQPSEARDFEDAHRLVRYYESLGFQVEVYEFDEVEDFTILYATGCSPEDNELKRRLKS